MMKKLFVPFTVALSLVALAPAPTASAQTNLNHRTKLTFSQPVEVPGRILPAGTYTFELNDSMANRHIVQIFDEAGTKIIGLVLAVPNRRLTATGDTVVKFAEVAAGQPQTMRAWFYPGETVGQEMVYPKTRARQLAVTANVIVPAVDDSFYENANADALKTVEVVSIAPEQAQAPVVVAQPAPVEPKAQPRKALPHTASTLPLIVLFGFGTLAFGSALRGLSTRRATR